jgi:hypothetical protein
MRNRCQFTPPVLCALCGADSQLVRRMPHSSVVGIEVHSFFVAPAATSPSIYLTARRKCHDLTRQWLKAWCANRKGSFDLAPEKVARQRACIEMACAPPELRANFVAESPSPVAESPSPVFATGCRHARPSQTSPAPAGENFPRLLNNLRRKRIASRLR